MDWPSVYDSPIVSSLRKIKLNQRFKANKILKKPANEIETILIIVIRYLVDRNKLNVMTIPRSKTKMSDSISR